MNKKLNKMMLAVFCSIALLSITSCDLTNKEDNQGLTPTEIKAAYETVKGNYTGLVFYNKIKENTIGYEKDSLPVSVAINTDSTLIIKNLPTKVLTGQLENKDLKKAIDDLGTTELKCYIGFVKNNPISILINPTVLSLNIMYNGKNQVFKTGFFINNRSSFAQVTGKDELSMQIIQFASMYLDDRLITARSNNSALLFKLKRN